MERITSIAKKVLPGHEFYDRLQEDVNQNDIKELKMNYAKVLVSVWSYASNADGVFNAKEGNLVGKMVSALFEKDCIFYQELDHKEEIINELSETFENPLPIKTISHFADGNPVMAANFYEDAVCIISYDNRVTKKERQVLDDLSAELAISNMDKKMIEGRYFKN